MATAHIKVPASGGNDAQEFVRFITRLQESVNLARQLKAKYDQVAIGGDWDAVATMLETTASGGNTAAQNAETAYNLLTNVQDELVSSSDISALLARLG